MTRVCSADVLWWSTALRALDDEPETFSAKAGSQTSNSTPVSLRMMKRSRTWGEGGDESGGESEGKIRGLRHWDSLGLV